MRHFGIALILVISLAACNMSMEKPAAEPLHSETVALSPQQPSTVQSSAAQQSQTSDKSTSDTAPQNSVPQKPVVQNSAPQNAAPQNSAPRVSAPQSAVAVLPPCSIRTDWQLYTVVSGDTLGQIAQRSGTDANTLASANCLKDANAISVGQALRVPSLPAPAPVNPAPVATTGRRPNLRNVGDFMGTPDLEGCWAANHGTDPVVFDRIDGSPIGWIGNRVHVLSATPTWVEVYVIGTMSIPDTTGWVRVSDVRLLGLCTEETGVQLDSYRGILFGNPAGIPDGVCAVLVQDLTTVVVYDQPKPLGRMIGTMIGWANWVSTEGDYYRFEQTGDIGDGHGIRTLYGLVNKSQTRLVNCPA